MRLEVADIPAQQEVRDSSITIEGQRQKSRHWLLVQEKWQCSVLCDSLMGKEEPLEGKALVEVASQGTALKLTTGHHCKNNKCAEECVA